MQYVIWILLAIFCSSPVIVSILVSKADDKSRQGGDVL